jgi:hypothetical protein
VILAPFAGFFRLGLKCLLGSCLVIFLPPFRVICSYSRFDRLLSRTLVSRLAPLSDRISIWILLSLVLGDSFGAEMISTSSLEDDSDVSWIRDFFAFFVRLFLGLDESELDLGLLFPLFLFAGSLEGPALSGSEGAVLCGTKGAAVSSFFVFLGLLLVGPEVLLTDCWMASRCFHTSSVLSSLELVLLSIAFRTTAICLLRL